MTPHGIERRLTDKFVGKGEMVFPNGQRVTGKYNVQIWREYSYGYPLSPTFSVKISSSEDPLLGMRYIGKEFVLELQDGKRLSLVITKDDGTAEHCPGVVEGFSGIKG